MKGSVSTRLRPSPRLASDFVAAGVARTSFSGSVTATLKTPASLNHGWCHGTNGIGRQPASSQKASSGNELVRKVTPFQ